MPYLAIEGVEPLLRSVQPPPEILVSRTLGLFVCPVFTECDSSAPQWSVEMTTFET